MGLLDGKVALVSGVGPGLGRATALAFAREGARVMLMARRAAALDSVRDEIIAGGGQAGVVAGDVRVADSCADAVARTVGTFGRIDVLVANAFAQGTPAAPTATTEEDWRVVLETNLLGPLALVRAAVPSMKEAGGSIIMVASNQVWDVVPGFSAYAASKGALVQLTRHLAQELGRHAIRVNAVHPGLIMGPPAQGFLRAMAAEHGISEDDAYRAVAGKAALDHISLPEEIADTLVFFASDLARIVTGQSLSVDSGACFH